MTSHRTPLLDISPSGIPGVMLRKDFHPDSPGRWGTGMFARRTIAAQWIEASENADPAKDVAATVGSHGSARM